MKPISNLHPDQVVPEAAIEAIKVTDEVELGQRLPHRDEREKVDFEGTVNDVLAIMTDNFEARQLECFGLSNGGFFMAPVEQSLYRIRTGSGRLDGEVSASAAGVIATAAAFSDFAFDPFGTRFAIAYQLLSEFIDQHPEAGTIRAVLDDLIDADY